MLRLAVLPALLTASAATAELYVDNPGLCDADSAVQELADLTILTPNGIDAHLANCEWDSPQTYEDGRTDTITGQCYDHSENRTYAVSADIDVNDQGRVTIFGPIGLPEFYFPCSRWGYKTP